jgi:hypothetical protein
MNDNVEKNYQENENKEAIDLALDEDDEQLDEKVSDEHDEKLDKKEIEVVVATKTEGSAVVAKPPLRPKTAPNDSPARTVLKPLQLTKSNLEKHKKSSSNSYQKTSHDDNKDIVVVEKASSTKSQNSKNSANKKQGWDRYFAFINDKEREKMSQLPELPLRKKKSKRDGAKSAVYLKRSKSAGFNNNNRLNKIKPDQSKKKELKAVVARKTSRSPSSTSSSENESSNRKSNKKGSYTDSENELDDQNFKREEKKLTFRDEVDNNINEQENSDTNYVKLPSFRSQNKSKATIRADSYNFGSHNNYYNYRDSNDFDPQSNSTHFNSTYRNLVRSLRANL